jgi:thiamine transport system permease protein
VPLGALLVDSLRSDGTWTLANYAALGGLFDGTTQQVSAWSAIANSLAFAAVATGLALVFALPTVALVSRPGRGSRILDRVVMLPLGASAATIGFGFLAAYSSGVLDLRGAWMAVPIVQAVVTVPLVVRALVPSVMALDPALGECAATCGGDSSRRFREIWWPLLRAPLGAGLGLAVAVSLGEFGATAFVARSSRPTVPIVIAQLLGRPGESNFGAAMALSVLLAAICGVLFAVIDRGGGSSVGDFG